MGKRKDKDRSDDRVWEVLLIDSNGEDYTHSDVTNLVAKDDYCSFYKDGLKIKTNLSYIAIQKKVEEKPEEKDDE